MLIIFGNGIVLLGVIMSNEEINEFIKMFKGVLPDPDNYPVTFDYYYQLKKHTKENKNV